MSRARVRLLVFVAWALLLHTGPFLRHCGVPARPSWHMYRGYASGLCVLDVFERDAAGQLVEVEKLDVLGYRGRHFEAPGNARRARDLEAANKLVDRLCRAHKAPLFVDVRCGVGGAWRQQRAPDRDACAAAPGGTR